MFFAAAAAAVIQSVVFIRSFRLFFFLEFRFLETGDVAHQRQTASDGEERAPKGEYSQHASVSRVQAELHPGFHLLCDVGHHDGALFWGFAGEDL